MTSKQADAAQRAAEIVEPYFRDARNKQVVEQLTAAIAAALAERERRMNLWLNYPLSKKDDAMSDPDALAKLLDWLDRASRGDDALIREQQREIERLEKERWAVVAHRNAAIERAEKYEQALRDIEAMTRNVNTRRSQRSRKIHELATAALDAAPE